MFTRWHLQNWLYVKLLTISVNVACYPRSDLYQQRKPYNWYHDWQLGSQTGIIQHAESLSLVTLAIYKMSWPTDTSENDLFYFVLVKLIASDVENIESYTDFLLELRR